jgi:hypothetical protein
MCPSNTEKRSEPRKAFHSLIDFVIEQNEEQGTLTARVTNISESGLRIYLGYPLREGQIVMMNERLSNGHQRYRVQWCNKVEENVFEAGLKSSQ